MGPASDSGSRGSLAVFCRCRDEHDVVPLSLTLLEYWTLPHRRHYVELDAIAVVRLGDHALVWRPWLELLAVVAKAVVAVLPFQIRAHRDNASVVFVLFYVHVWSGPLSPLSHLLGRKQPSGRCRPE